MKHYLLCGLLTTLASCSNLAVDVANDGLEVDRQQLLAKIDQFNSAIRDGDKDRYADVFVDDFIFTWSRNGQIYNRELILPNVVPTPDFNPIVDEVMTRIYGDSAVANYRVRQKPEDLGTRVTLSYAKVNGEWKVIASHSTPIVSPTTDADE